MRHVKRRQLMAGAVLGALPLFLATGCSFSIGGPGVIAADEVAQRASEMLTEETGQAPDDLTCAEDLPAEEGAQIRCELTAGEDTLGVTVTVIWADGSDADLDVLVDDAPADETAADDAAADDTGGDTAADDTAGDDSAGSSAGDSVPAAEVAEQSAAQLEQAGQTFEGFTCSQDLPAQVGAEIRCNMVSGGMNYGVTITATSVQGTSVLWNIQVDDQAL
ncbi:DUF4333 domain-containing protein [Nocardiopsis aegyptia]|uniref:DUF4333 domain-containing protein n=1 Tax=Nocardiopsis aegyptia TaxID=220378 RepID=A0A7Z0ET56_9ACTN|nr:DUF4333 domain-containing protein [Nocardiopsis aegyptia]NYJ37719.1 hypothetical protein [Nocardiopsis aegyptia]